MFLLLLLFCTKLYYLCVGLCVSERYKLAEKKDDKNVSKMLDIGFLLCLLREVRVEM